MYKKPLGVVLYMELPCEQAIWYILPQIRADLARELVMRGTPQKEIAKLLDITPSAVSQYLHKKRGGKVKMPADYPKRIVKTAEALGKTKDKSQVMKLLCRCCTEAKAKAK